MRSMVCFLAATALFAGCLSKPASRVPNDPVDKNKKVVVTQHTIVIGTVVSVKSNLGFAVLNFPIGRIPPLDQRLNAYRRGLKVGEIKVTGPQQDENIVGDIMAGDVQPGDEIRSD